MEDQKEEQNAEATTEPSRSTAVIGCTDVRLSDLLDIIHFTLINKLGKNEVLLDEVRAIEYKIKHSNEVENFSVEETEMWKTILNHRNCR